MNRVKRLISYLLLACFGLIQTSCLGTFKLTNVTYQWNQTVGSKWINELVFVLFIPVYSVTLFIDAFILNAVDFWTERPGLSMKEGEEKQVSSKDGKDQYLMIKTKDGVQIKQTLGAMAGQEANFSFDEESSIWYLEQEDNKIKLVQLIETESGNYVNVFKPDGSSVMIDANLRDRATILETINQPGLSTSIK